MDVFNQHLISVKKITANAPPGPFGPQDVMITNPGFGGPGFDRFIADDMFGFGLPFQGLVKAAATGTNRLIQDPLNAGKLLIGTGGSTMDGNKFFPKLTKEVAGSFRV
ncbi:hypothetical protein RZS08_52655, partial [Arthrospira platensis SPKY1]|nr:hypothetical protein [Arthrospira platensis SPKY1]